MTNPNNAVGTPAAFSGRTSVKAFNNITGAYTRGIISGWACAPVSGLTVAVGGNAGTRDIAVAEDANGNRTTISNISEAPIEVVMGSSPSTYNRIDAIVAYVEPSPTGDNSTQDNPAACGIIPVAGTAAANPVQPTDAQIRSAITTDGGTGASAYYVILDIIERTPGQTTIAAGNITAGTPAGTRAPRMVKDFTSELTAISTPQTGNTWAFLYEDGTVEINIRIQNVSSSAGANIFTVPNDYKPRAATYGVYCVGNNVGGMLYTAVNEFTKFYAGNAISGAFEAHLIYRTTI